MEKYPHSRIQILPPSVADKIAAGEVVERPSSVVKEFVENALDAGASEIAVILEDGGKSLIEVIDNGHGMGSNDLMACTQRHATSKIHSLSDLEQIQTLGFRGEALPSIAAVSELSFISRSQDQPPSGCAYEWMTQSVNPITFGHFLGSLHGTRARAQGLFAQFPARLKFLKSQSAELSHIREWIERLALSRPTTGFCLVSNDRTLLQLRPQDETSRVLTLLANGGDFPLLTETLNDFPGKLNLRIHWVQGLSIPQMRHMVQIVNGRAVRDRLLQQALLSAFKQILLPGQFPALALFVEMDPTQLDVNVHPAKTEIRFLESQRVFHAVHSVVKSLVSRHGAPARVLTESPTPNTRTSFQTVPLTLSTPISSQPLPMTWQASEPKKNHDFHPNNFTGIIFNTYLIYDLGEELALIDQHAAHERIRYEQLRKRWLGNFQGKSQALLIPEVTHFSLEQKTALASRLAWLEKLGFEAEFFGNDSLIFRAIPLEWGTDFLHIRLKNLMERLLGSSNKDSSEKLLLDESLFEALASEACHSAVRSGDRLDRLEALTLTDELFRCEHPWNCPHGRPTTVRIQRTRFEEWFKRRI